MAINRATRRVRSTLVRAVFGSLRLVPIPLYDRFKRMPVLSAPSRRLLDATLPSSGLSVVTIRSGPIGGLAFELQPRMNKDMALGRYEHDLSGVIKDLTGEGSICFDVGAHLGYMSLVMARRAGPAGEVVAFEPDPQLFEVLLRNARRNRGPLASVIPIRAAAGRSSGRRSFRQGESSGTGRLDDAAGDLMVEVTTLDDAADVHGIPNLVKLDVEGAEVEALLGATGILSRGRSTFLIEAHSPNLEGRCRKLLRDFRYDVAPLEAARKETSHLLARPCRA